MAQSVGPGGSKRNCEYSVGKSVGPGGAGGSGSDVTTKRGYESKRTTGLRDAYKQSGSADNSKAGRS